MTSYSAQGSITIRRVRSGDTLFITFANNGIALYQGVDTNTGAITPDWTVSANQPIVTPQVTSARGETVTLSAFAWTYNGTALDFSGDEDGDYIKDTTGKFEMNPSTGALKIIDNLASTTNYANDTLEFSCTATLAGVEYTLTKSTDIIIQNVGASSYMGLLTATTEQLTGDVTESVITAQLKLAGENADSYIKWYKNDLDSPWTDMDGYSSVTVSRDDVEGTTLFIAEFYLSSADTSPVYRAAIRIIDAADEYQIVYAITSDNKTVDTDADVEVTGKVYNMRTNTVVDMTDAVWTTYVMRTSDWTATQTVNSNVVTVTTADTDTADGNNDVEVVGEVSWSE